MPEGAFLPPGVVKTGKAGSLTGSTLASGVTASSLTSVGTVTSGIWNAGAVTSSGAVTGASLVADLTTLDANALGTSSGNLTISAADGADVLIGDNETILYVDGDTGCVGVGAAPPTSGVLAVGGTFQGDSFTSALRVTTALTDPAGDGTNAAGVYIATTFTDVVDTSTPTRASLRVVAPTINGGNAGKSGTSVTNSASVYIAGAPSGGATPTNGHYSIFVDAGNSRFDGNIKMGTNSEFSTTEGTNGIIFGAGTAPNGTASTAGQLYSDNSGDDLSFEHADGTEDELTT
jgi:hypothetical protein